MPLVGVIPCRPLPLVEMFNSIDEMTAQTEAQSSLDAAIHGRRVARLNGALSMAANAARKGDQVFVLFGGQVLYVLRPVEGHYQFIGECYVHGLMDGEGLQNLETGLTRIQTVRIR